MTRACRRPLAVAAALLVVFSAAHSTARAGDGWTLDTMMTVKRVSSVTPSPDATKVAFVVGTAVMEGEKSEWVSQLHLAAADGSWSRQLTRGEKSATSPRWSPDGRWIAFLSSRSGKANVWRISPDGGEAEMVTDVKGGVSSFDWSPDGASLALVMRDVKTDEEEKAAKEKRDWRTIDANIKHNRLYVVPSAPRGGEPRLLTAGDYSVNGLSWSPDGKTIAIEHQKTPAVDHWPTSDISLVTIADGSVRPLVAGPAAESDPIYSPDGTSIAFVKSVEPTRWARAQRVHVVPVDGGAPRALGETPDGQPGLVGWSADGRRLIVGETQGVVGRVFALPVDGGAPQAIDGGTASLSGVTINVTGRVLGYVAQDSDRAPEPHAAPLGDRLAGVKVASVQPALPPAPGRTEVVAWTSRDGRRVEGLLTYPDGYRAGTRVPLLLVIHGGPAGVFTRAFLGAASPYPLALFAARGYAVLRVNPRGSSGYGVEFRQANRGDWGGGDYRDLMSGVDHVVAMGVADEDRLGVMGWSYGGFMTSWVITQTGRFKAASAGAAVTHLTSFTGVTDIPSFIPDYFGGEFWDRDADWRAHSPLSHVKGVRTPTLIQHGDADDRVPISQGYELYNALRRQGVTTTFTVYPRQPHGFTEPKMTLDAARANVEWFDRFVMNRPAPTTSRR
jgi:dipeptidyl aminopeptidase/acylaminoacyl peptidase